MGDRVAVLKDGLLQQVDTPRNLYDTPVNSFVAGFIGSPGMNLREAELVDGGARLGDVVIGLRREIMNDASKAGLTSVILGIRPEAFDPSTDGQGVKLNVKLVEELGSDAYVYGSLGDGGSDEVKHFVVRFDGRTPPRHGETVQMSVRPGAEHAFNPETGERLG